MSAKLRQAILECMKEDMDQGRFKTVTWAAFYLRQRGYPELAEKLEREHAKRNYRSKELVK